MRKGKRGKAKGLLAKKVKRDYLKREHEYGKLTMAKCMKNWKNILTTISNKYLEKELISCCHIFERNVDYKDLEISLLMDWLENELEHQRMSFIYHAHLIDHMIQFFQNAFKSIYSDLASQVNKLIFDWTNSCNETLFRSQENQKNIGTMIYQMIELNRDREYDEEARTFTYFDECRATSETILNNLKAIMHNKIEKLYQNIVKFTNEYLNEARNKKETHDILADHHKRHENQIISNVEKIFSMKKLIQNLMEKFDQISEVEDKKLKDLTMERDRLNECFLTLRSKLLTDRNNDVDKRLLLVSSCNEVYGKLEEKAGEGTKMIKCLKTCRKYTTLNEKLCPYPVGKAQFDNKLDEFAECEFFWSKIAGVNRSRFFTNIFVPVHLTTMAIRCELNEERNYLKLENKKLKQQIHNHCQCFYCPILPPIPTRVGRIPHTDGKNMIRKQDRQNRRK